MCSKDVKITDVKITRYFLKSEPESTQNQRKTTPKKKCNKEDNSSPFVPPHTTSILDNNNHTNTKNADQKYCQKHWKKLHLEKFEQPVPISMPAESFIDMGHVFNSHIERDHRKIFKRILTEMSQKTTYDCSSKQQYLFKDGDLYICKCPLHEGDKRYRTNSKGEMVPVTLTRAHVGQTRENIIQSVLNDFPDEKYIITLLNEVMKRHIDTQIVLCCRTCNKELEKHRYVQKI